MWSVGSLHGAKDLVGCRHREIYFLILIVEVRRHPHAAARPPVNQNVALEQLGAHCLCLGHIHCDGAARGAPDGAAR